MSHSSQPEGRKKPSGNKTKGILNRGTQVHKTNKKYNRNDIPIEEMDMEETYTFRQIRCRVKDNFKGHQFDQINSTFEAETLTEVLDQFKAFLRKCGYTYIGDLTATSRLDNKTWTTTEEKV